MDNILHQIIEHKKEELKQKKFYFPLTKFIKDLKKSHRNFKQALKKPGLSLIGEIKKASPSSGLIQKNFDPLKIAEVYQKYVDAISVVTEDKFFQGKLEYLNTINKISKIPLLQKDFIIDEYQVYEARYYGADAILLIASLFKREEIDRFIKIAKNYHMYTLVEVHSLKQLEKTLETEADLIGINNRDLNTFEIDLQNTVRLAPHIPDNKIIVSESGLQNAKDLELMRANVDAVLVGTSLMQSKNLEEKLKRWRTICDQVIDQHHLNKQLTII